MSPVEECHRILAQYTPISLGEMDGVRLMDRVDTKYLVRDQELPSLLRQCQESYRALAVENARLMPYSTLYFDSPTSECYLAHHNGKTNRSKYRMRRYEASGITFFEVKQRTGRGRTVKQRAPIESIGADCDVDTVALAESLTGRQIDLHPQVWTRFSRMTLVSEDPAERVTIDLQIEFDKGDEHAALPGVAIIEVKQSQASRESRIREQLRKACIRPMRVSKYCVGRALLEPRLKQNRFKPKLLTLRSLMT